jgi:DNA replication protein DnaC
MAECDDRARCRSERSIKAAAFPRDKSLRAFEFDANPHVDPAVVHTLAKCDWVKKGLPLCLIGDSGTGKSHLLIALGTEAGDGRLPGPLRAGHQAGQRASRSRRREDLAKTIARYGRVDLLCIDELGYVKLDKRGAELLFQVLTDREDKASVAIASNEAFSKAHMFARTCVRFRLKWTGFPRNCIVARPVWPTANRGIQRRRSDRTFQPAVPPRNGHARVAP